MYFNFNGVVSALTLAATLSNAASIPRSTKGAFSVTQVPFARNASSVFEHWTATLKKHKGRIPTYEKSNGGNEQGSAKVTPIGGDEEYLVPVTIGGDTLNLDLDTGSSDLWVFSSQAPQSEVGQHNTYKPGNSSKKLPNSSWEISYVDGSGASGNVYTDEVSIAGVSVKNQGVEAATQVSSSFTEDTQNDGLIGMAFSKLNTAQPKQKTFFDNILSQLDKPVLTATLKHNSPGTYDFGYIDDSKYTGTITYTDVDIDTGYWTVNADGYSIGSKQGESFTGVVDTGSSLIMIDNEIAAKYYDQVPGSQLESEEGMYYYECGADLPDFSVKFGDYEAKVPGKLLEYANTGTICLGGIQPNNGGDNILGDIFIKTQFVVFENNGDSARVGFAPQAGLSTSSSSSASSSSSPTPSPASSSFFPF